MAEEPKSSGNVSDKVAQYVENRANGRGYDAERYADVALYVLMYNRIKNNRFKILRDLTEPKLPDGSDNPDYVSDPEKRQNIIDWCGISSTTGDEIGWLIRDNVAYFNKAYDLEMSNEDISNFSNEYYRTGLYEFARELGQACGNRDGSMLTVSQMAMVMEAKTNDARKVFESYRKNVSDKGDDYYDKDKGEYKGGFFYNQLRIAQDQYDQKTSEVRRKGIKAALFGVLGVGAAALTVTSFFTALPFVGFSLFGFGGAGAVVAGLAGTVVGGILTKIGLGGFLERVGSWWRLRQDRKNFKLGLGKYKDGDKGEKKSLKGREDEYWRAHYVRSLFFNYRDFTYIQKEFNQNFIKEYDKTHTPKYKDLSDAEKANVDKEAFEAFKKKYKKYLKDDTPGKEKWNVKGLEKDYLLSRDYTIYVDPKRKIKYNKRHTVTFQGQPLVDRLWEELENNYSVAAEGKTGWGGVDHLYWGKFAKVRAKLTHQPTEYATERMTTQTLTFTIKEHCEKDEIDFELLKKDVRNLFMLEEDFKTNNDLTTFKEIKLMLSNRLVEGFRDQILNQAFTTTTLSDIRQIIEKDAKDPDLRKILEDPGEGDNLDDVENVLSWLESEVEAGYQYDGKKYVPFSPDLGVGVEYQIKFDKNSLLNGCKQISKDFVDAHSSAINSIISGISGLTTQKAATAVQTEITTLRAEVGSQKICHYLEVQLARKKEQCTYGDELDIFSEVGDKDVAQALIDIMNPNKKINPADIRTLIISKISDEATRKVANRILDQQLAALEIADRNKQRQDVYDAVRNNNYIGLQDKLNQIREFKELDAKAAKDLYNKIMNGDVKDGIQDSITDESVKQYLVSKLKYRIFQLIRDDVSNEKYQIVGENKPSTVINNLKSLFVSLNQHVTNGTIELWQKDKLMNLYSEQINNGLTEYLKTMEKNVLDGEKHYDEEAQRMLKTAASGGFGDFLALKTAAAIEAQERLNRIKDFSLKNLFMPGAKQGWEGMQYSSDNGSTEIKSMMYSYLRKDRSAKDPDDENYDKLTPILRTMESIYNDVGKDKNKIEEISAVPPKYQWVFKDDRWDLKENENSNEMKVNVENFTTGAIMEVDGNGSFIVRMVSVLKQIDSIEDKQDKLIALTVLKRRIIGLVVAQLSACRARFETVSQFQESMNANITKISQTWTNFGKMVDDRINDCIRDLRYDANLDPKIANYIVGVKGNTADNIGKCCSSANVQSIITMKTMQQE